MFLPVAFFCHACHSKVSTIRVGAAFFTFVLPGDRVYGAGCSVFFPVGQLPPLVPCCCLAGWIRTSTMHVYESSYSTRTS
jgi:hypothetical protein